LVDNILRTQVVEGVTLLSFFASFFPKKRRSSRDSGAARQFAFFAKLSFSRKENPSECYSTEVLQSFFQKRRSSRDSGAARQFAFFAKLSFSRKKAERGGTLRFPPLKLPTLKGLPVTPQSHWVLPLSYCACAPGASAFGTLSGRSRLIARPPLILATFVASALLAWKCSQSTFACGLRARRQPPRTRVLNMPQRASTNIGNRAFCKRNPGGRYSSGVARFSFANCCFSVKRKISQVCSL